jgi:hypothetical protein
MRRPENLLNLIADVIASSHQLGKLHGEAIPLLHSQLLRPLARRLCA